MGLKPPPERRFPALRLITRWFDNESAEADAATQRRIEWGRVLPFIALHLACFSLPWVGVSPTAVAVALALYALRMFAITAFYHRYCAHRAFRMSRAAQLAFALLASTAGQRGPLWWASQHRHHHLHSDTPRDAHSARQHGFWWSHVGWFLATENFATRHALVPDLARCRELRLLDRYDVVGPLGLGVLLYVAGALLEARAPWLGVTGAQLVAWGLCISTVVLYHATFAINSVAHRYGHRRYATKDDSRNNLLLALLTLGEGWHNNHHHFPGAARQGVYWWEVDATYYALRALACLGIVSELRRAPPAMLRARRVASGARPASALEASRARADRDEWA